jgi:hypothetical protein
MRARAGATMLAQMATRFSPLCLVAILSLTAEAYSQPVPGAHSPIFESPVAAPAVTGVLSFTAVFAVRIDGPGMTGDYRAEFPVHYRVELPGRACLLAAGDWALARRDALLRSFAETFPAAVGINVTYTIRGCVRRPRPVPLPRLRFEERAR